MADARSPPLKRAKLNADKEERVPATSSTSSGKSSMFHLTDDCRIRNLRPILSPAVLMEELALSEEAERFVAESRKVVSKILAGEDDRLLVVIGPCSIHDVVAAREYAQKLKVLAEKHKNELFVIMRVYFEKPRTTVGWKGLINDPDLNESFQIGKGLRMGRSLLVHLAESGVPAGCEMLDTITPQFFADCVTWSAIGARTTESQVHRELASGLSMPVGFKNGTDGKLQIAIDAVQAVSHPHSFLSVTKQGIVAIVRTDGNPDSHVILRGGSTIGPNYTAPFIKETKEMLVKKKLPPKIMVDCSHGNSNKDHNNQPVVAADLASQIAGGEDGIVGVMIESNINAGRQDLKPGATLQYGVSITDACIDLMTSEQVLNNLANAKRQQRERRK